jgi:hypothetical protein
MEATDSFEKLATVYQTTWHHIPEENLGPEILLGCIRLNQKY